MRYNKAKELKGGSKIKVKKTGEIKTVRFVTKCVKRPGIKVVDIFCDDYKAYYNSEVKMV